MNRTHCAPVQNSAESVSPCAQSLDQARWQLRELQEQQTTLHRENEDMRRSRDEVAAELARYTDLYDLAPIGYLTVSSGGDIIQLNVAAATLLDQAPVLAAGKHLARFIRDEDRAGLSRLLARVFVTDERQSCVLMLAGEAARTVQIEATRMGNRQNCRMMMLDVSARIHAETERALSDAQSHEVQKMEALGTLAGGIAHDFNNILGTILGNVALASDGCDAADPDRVCLDEIKKASLRAQRLVEQVLAFSRRRPRQLVDQSLQPVMTAALQLMRASLPSNVSLTSCAPQSPILARVDSVQIEQVLLNVMTNAWEATPPTGGNISVELCEAGPDTSEAANGEPTRCASILISDSGHGMDEATLRRIYEPFFTTKSPDKGIGLGLAVAHGIMTDHGGSIRVCNTSSAGTTFELRLPIVGRPQSFVAAASPTPPPSMGSGQHVLYLDDDEPMVYMVRRLLQKLGYRVSAYERSDEALTALRSDPFRFDLVVTDFNMPGPSGVDVVPTTIAPALAGGIELSHSQHPVCRLRCSNRHRP